MIGAFAVLCASAAAAPFDTWFANKLSVVRQCTAEDVLFPETGSGHPFDSTLVFTSAVLSPNPIKRGEAVAISITGSRVLTKEISHCQSCKMQPSRLSSRYPANNKSTLDTRSTTIRLVSAERWTAAVQSCRDHSSFRTPSPFHHCLQAVCTREHCCF